MTKDKNQLPEAVAREFEVKGGHPFKFVHARLGRVDLNMVNLKQARALYDQGIGHLVKKQVKKPEMPKGQERS